MENPTIQLDAGGQAIPFLDQWLGTWFMEPERGQALFAAIKQLNIGMHLQQRTAGNAPRADVCDGCGLPYEGRAQHGPLCGNCKTKKSDDTAPDDQDPPPNVPPVTIDWEKAPQIRSAYGYRVIDGVAVLELNGSLMKQEASAMESTSTVMMRRTCRKLANDDQVKAVIFQIDSPGGTVAGAYELAKDIGTLAKVKPVHAHAANLIASAAYLMASQMRSISATPSTLVGSLGAYGVVYDYSAAAEKDGIKVHLIKGRVRGKESLMKGAGTPGTEITAEQLARFQENTDDLNEQFIEAVINGPRKPKQDSVLAWFTDAGVWIAEKSRVMGLIDRVEDFDQMLSRVAVEAGGKKPAQNNQNSITAGPDTAADAGAIAPDASLGAETASTKETPMSQVQQTAAGTSTAAAQTAQASNEPKPATIAELKAAYPNDSGFALDCAEKALTLLESKAAYADVLMKRNSELQQKNAELQTAASSTQAQQTGKRTGVKAIESATGEQSGTAASGDAVESFNELVSEQMNKPGYQSDRRKAILAVAKREPEMHVAYLNATNPGRKQRDMIADKYAA